MDRDGGNQQRLTDAYDDNFPDWSPDGTRVAFVSNRGGDEDVYVMAMDGTGLRNHAAGGDRTDLSRTPVGEGRPAWSPDGRQIVYASQETGNYSLYMMDHEGEHRRRITSPRPPYWDARPQIATDGRSIVFNRSDGKTIAIYTLQLPAR